MGAFITSSNMLSERYALILGFRRRAPTAGIRK
jgi:hypothetical protein